jgi:hypothetical protein
MAPQVNYLFQTKCEGSSSFLFRKSGRYMIMELHGALSYFPHSCDQYLEETLKGGRAYVDLWFQKAQSMLV